MNRTRARTPSCAASRLLLALFVLIAGSACGDPGTEGVLERVVVVSKQINEFMYEIVAEDVIIARDLTSVYPPAIKEKTSVGYHRALSAEGIISTRPTLLLTDGNVGPDAVIQQVKDVGIPVLVMRGGSTVDSAQALMAALGKRFHREAAADSVIAVWRQGMASIGSDSAKWAGQPRPRVLMIHFGQIINNYLAVNRGSTADRILHWAGGENAIDSLGGMTRLTPELIARAAPDVIIATDVGFDRFGSAEKFAQLPGVSLTPAGRDGRIYRVDESEIMYFGPRTPAAVKRIAGLLHP